jgi:hypothetical protein
MADPQVCAFCARPKAQVRNLIAGDGLGHTSVGICEACVGTSYDMLVKSGTLAAKPAPVKDLDAASAIRNAVRAMPRKVDVSALANLATAGIALAAGNAAQLRSLAYDLGNAMAFEEALRVRAGVAAFERNVADSLAEAAYQTRIGNPREGVAVLERLAKGPLASAATPAENAGASMARMYARLAALPWDNDVNAILAELTALEPKLPTIGLDASFLRALLNQATHIRARAAMALHRDAEAVRILTAQLAVRELDIEALALVIEAYEKTGDRASAARAREKAMLHVPANSAYARRIGASGR